MPTSEARIRANQANSLKSTGPRTPEGKAQSRANAVKHGLTGEGVALSAADAAEVDRMQKSFEADLKPASDLGKTLVRRMALLALRMERCVAHESASIAERVELVQADFDLEWPEGEGVEDPERQRMRTLAAKRALFDPSKEACLARKYEAAAERGFFRAMKELRQVEKQVKAGSSGLGVPSAREALASFVPAETIRSLVDAPVAKPAANVVEPTPKHRPQPAFAGTVERRIPADRSFELPFSIGRTR